MKLHNASGQANTKLQAKLSLSFRRNYKLALDGAISKLHAKLEVGPLRSYKKLYVKVKVSSLWSYAKASCEARSELSTKL